jgi:DNA modification methylase
MIELNKTYLDDCLNKLQEIPDNYIDLICVDPPILMYQKTNMIYI